MGIRRPKNLPPYRDHFGYRFRVFKDPNGRAGSWTWEVLKPDGTLLGWGTDLRMWKATNCAVSLVDKHRNENPRGWTRGDVSFLEALFTERDLG